MEPLEVIEYNDYFIEIFDNEDGCNYNIQKDGLLVYSGGAENPSDCIFDAQFRIDRGLA